MSDIDEVKQALDEWLKGRANVDMDNNDEKS